MLLLITLLLLLLLVGPILLLLPGRLLLLRVGLLLLRIRLLLHAVMPLIQPVILERRGAGVSSVLWKLERQVPVFAVPQRARMRATLLQFLVLPPPCYEC
jgi:hypothetical protein